MTYLFNTPDQQQEMLQTIGVDSLEALFSTIPSELRLNRPLDMHPALTEMELQAHVTKLAEKNVGPGSRVCMLGGGAYDHFIPAAVDEIARRGEFYTAYTPYQAEASQGSLQTFFEFQSLICQLTGMDVSNASLYEGGTCVSEAAFMAMRVTNRHDRVVLLGSLHPEYRQVVETYLKHLNCEVVIVPCAVAHLLFELQPPPRPQDRNRARVEVDRPPARRCLRRADFGFVADGQQLLINDEAGLVEFDVSPRQAQQLAAAHPGVRLQVDRGEPHRVLDRCKEAAQFVR